jgi:outer membrane immunogenic protein
MRLIRTGAANNLHLFLLISCKDFLPSKELLIKEFMKLRQGFVVAISCAAVGTLTVTHDAYAQSAFAGFYGQVSTGYEGNQLGTADVTIRNTPNINTDHDITAPSQNFGSAPLVLGVGYYWQASEKWLIGVGADYSTLTQTGPSFTTSFRNAAGSTSIAPGEVTTSDGDSRNLSNRFNLFITPAYAIDKDKLVYLKAGYSQVSIEYNRTSSVTRTINGVSTKYPASGGSQTDNYGGFIVGLGYKQIITGGLYGFAEGNYMSYGSPGYSYNPVLQPSNTARGVTPAGTRVVNTNISSFNSYQLLVGVGYAF